MDSTNLSHLALEEAKLQRLQEYLSPWGVVQFVREEGAVATALSAPLSSWRPPAPAGLWRSPSLHRGQRSELICVPAIVQFQTPHLPFRFPMRSGSPKEGLSEAPSAFLTEFRRVIAPLAPAYEEAAAPQHLLSSGRPREKIAIGYRDLLRPGDVSLGEEMQPPFGIEGDPAVGCAIVVDHRR